MAEENKEDQASKTEQPTAHRQEKAREKGNIAQSRELSHFLVLCTFLLFLWWMGGSISQSLLFLLRSWIQNAGKISCDGMALHALAQKTVWASFQAVGGFLATLVLLIVMSTGLQTKWRIAKDALNPKISRISLQQGIKRLFSLKNSVEFLKSVGKLILIVGMALWILTYQNFSFHFMTHLQTLSILSFALRIVMQVLLSLVSAMAILAALDYGYQWFHVFKSLYMSRQDLKDEHKELEGDPAVASRQKQMMRELSQMRKIGEKVPQATLVITNPQHYAVALRWVPSEMTAPKVIAKGTDRVARRIRLLAKDHFIPVHENPPLARLLYATVKTDQEIFPEHYKAVAEVIRYVLHVQGQKKA